MGSPERKRSRGSGVRLWTLAELAARVAGAQLAGEAVEAALAPNPVPEPVQRRLLYWAFPRDEAALRLYGTPAPSTSATSSPPSSSPDSETPFAKGLQLLHSDAVCHVLQIGYHLSGSVERCDRSDGDDDRPTSPYQVSLSFDRCKITGIRCSCEGSGSAWWCAHAVALALHRIRFPDACRLRLPISDTLSQLGRDQLQKVLQWVVSSHPGVLPTAQSLVDGLGEAESGIATAAGAPDPTAGPPATADPAWYLDEEAAATSVRKALASVATLPRLLDLFAKVREMLSSRDENGPRLLRIITEQFLATPMIQQSFGQPGPPPPYSTLLLTDKSQMLWDSLAGLWVLVVLNPFCRLESKATWHSLLKKWAQSRGCPLESGAGSPRLSRGSGSRADEPRTVFHRALDACRVQWNHTHLRRIIQRQAHPPSEASSSHRFTAKGQPIWDEHVPTACSRVESLRAHGYEKEALALAVALCRYIQTEASLRRTAESGWLQHPLDPMNALLDCLLAASASSPPTSGSLIHRRVRERRRVNSTPSAPMMEEEASGEMSESYLSLGAEVGLVALSRVSRASTCAYARAKATKQEQALVDKLRKLPLDHLIFRVYKTQAKRLLKDDVWSGLRKNREMDSTGILSLSLFLFQALLEKDADLAYRLGLKSLEVPPKQEEESETSFLLAGSALGWPFPGTESQHNRLACALILAARESQPRLRQVVDVIRVSVRAPAAVLRLAQEVQREAETLASDSASHGRQNLGETALELGLHVLAMTRGQAGWPRRSVMTWLRNCLATLTLKSLNLILRHWNSYFSPQEAVTTLAQAVHSVVLAVPSKHSPQDREALTEAVQNVALGCLVADPGACALDALMLCESSRAAEVQAYRLVVTAGQAARIGPDELFKVAHRLDTRGHRLDFRALEVGLLALAHSHISHSDDTSPLVQEIYWITALSFQWYHHNGSGNGCWSVGMLEKVVGCVVKNVMSAVVLSEIVRRTLNIGWPPHHFRKKPAALLPPLPQQAKALLGRGGALRPILDAAIKAFVSTIHARLTHISPRHYGEFLEFLVRARDTFLLSPEGEVQFSRLLESMRYMYKGKKKLLSLVASRFALNCLS